MRRVIDVAHRGAAAHLHRARARIDARPAHRRKVDHETVVDRSETRAVVSSAADGDVEAVGAAECERRLHVGYVMAACDDRGALVDHRVVDLACLVVLGVFGRDDLAANLRPKLLEPLEPGDRRHSIPPYVVRTTPF